MAAIDPRWDEPIKPITVDILNKALEIVRGRDKALAYDNIPDVIIRMARQNERVFIHLLRSVNRILRERDGSWFTGRVVFLKKDDKFITSYGSIRPIVIMSPVAKLIEAIA